MERKFLLRLFLRWLRNNLQKRKVEDGSSRWLWRWLYCPCSSFDFAQGAGVWLLSVVETTVLMWKNAFDHYSRTLILIQTVALTSQMIAPVQASSASSQCKQPVQATLICFLCSQNFSIKLSVNFLKRKKSNYSCNPINQGSKTNIQPTTISP